MTPNYDESVASPELLPPGGLEDPRYSASRPPRSFGEALMLLWRERRFIAKVTILGSLVAVILAFVIPPRYQSTTRIVPPSGANPMSALAMLAGGGGLDDKLGALAGDTLGIKSSSALYAGMLRSRTVQDALINRFDLRKVYGRSLYETTREKLADNTEITEDRKTGILSVSVTDRSPERATQLAHAYVEELNRVNASMSTTAAQRERQFIEERLKTVKVELDDATQKLSAFSRETITLDPREQGKAVVGAIATLEAQVILAEAKLRSLEQVYTDNNIRVRAARAQVEEFRRQLAKLEGERNPTVQAEATSLPSLRSLPGLGVTYFDLFRRVKIQEAVFEILTKQYELAKVQEAKDTPVIRVLDQANRPEIKSYPKRTLMVLGAFLLSYLGAVFFVLARERWSAMGPEHPARLLHAQVNEGIRRDYQLVRFRLKEKLGRGSADDYLPK